MRRLRRMMFRHMGQIGVSVAPKRMAMLISFRGANLPPEVAFPLKADYSANRVIRIRNRGETDQNSVESEFSC